MPFCSYTGQFIPGERASSPDRNILDDFHGQPHDAVICKLIATDEPGGEFRAGIHYRSQFLCDRLLQIAQSVIEKPDADSIWIVWIIRLSDQAEIADVLVAPLENGLLAVIERDAGKFGLKGCKQKNHLLGRWILEIVVPYW